uniref:Putative scp-like extracellular protein n=1 Tax=Corethrella appendiculata TaxID=1370023 RepID=U5EXX7_9DIPT
MEVCCLKMASRCRPSRPIKDITQLCSAGSSHDCGSLSRVVMVRKTDQKVINHHKSGQKDPQCEVITMETIQTYKGHRPDRTVVFKEKHDLTGCDLTKSLSTSKIMGSPRLSISPLRTVLTNTNELNVVNNKKPNDSNNNDETKSLNEVKLTPNKSAIRQKSPSLSASQSSLRRSIFTEFELESLKAHNEYRLKHGVLPLKLNKRICRYADEWAKVIAARGVLIHRNNSQYGENIFCSWSNTNSNIVVSGREPVENWYSEISSHVFGKEPSTLKSGHFTQIVWKESKELGVAIARNRSGQVFVVANYDPPGNYIGSFAKNVPPIGGFEMPVSILSESCTNSEKKEKHVRIADEPEKQEFDEFSLAMLKHHNEYRKKHLAPNLTLNADLTYDAQQWAEILARDDRFTYRQNSKYGENLYCLWSSDRSAMANPKDVCRSWYEEVKQYSFNNEPKGIIKGGQFTQMVWKSTKEMGVGFSKTRSGKVIVVATYYPRGNVFGQFLANVCKKY